MIAAAEADDAFLLATQNDDGIVVTTDATDYTIQAQATLKSLNLTPGERRVRPISGHNTSVLLPCRGTDGRPFLLKYFIPPAERRFYPAGVRIEDYARREGAFYRLLDSIDPHRQLLPAPKTILIDSGDPPAWILLEWIEPAVGPIEEVMSSDHIFDLMRRLRDIPLNIMLGRRDFPMSHWDVVSYLDRFRLMYESVFEMVGDARWKRCQEFYTEATRWTEARKPVLVHGDFHEQNIMVDADGRPFLVDFERIGIGNEDHDFAWLWIHSQRTQEFKRNLIERYFGPRFGSDRIKAEWGIRSALAHVALRRLHFGGLRHGPDFEDRAATLGLLDAALNGGTDLFPAAD